ncbi:PAS domain S-box protein [Geomonas sp. Red32]|uniref:PAS domain S-box protein n=1 Tax=Geomonas sp. Red32 TaxID=2912856 RepID=UPI00202CFA47|nr:PAS domain S-box protein [Geomonas sp. Red32]MCM0082605.1 PAS domain S-box protein [Geomonas sp. Red32]
MTRPAEENVHHGLYRNPLLWVGLVVAGVAGNRYPFTFFLDIHFLFGSIFSLLALQFFGLRRGMAAGAVIAGSAWLFQGTPYPALIMAAEVAAVGFLVLRRNMAMVVADTCYWLFAGIPATYLCYHLALALPYGSTTITMAKLTVNGITNALVARMLYMAAAVYSRRITLSYREIMHNLFSFFVLFPSLVVLAFTSRADFRDTERAIRTSLDQDSQRIDRLMESWALSRKQNLVVLADTIAKASPSEIRPYLALATRAELDFRQIALMDRSGEVVAFYPPPGPGGSPNVGLYLADRHYVPRLRQTLAPMLSDVSFLWDTPPRPRVAMLAPVVKRGEFAGYLCGVISLERTRTLLDKFTEHTGKLYTLTDKHGRVIMTNRPVDESGSGSPPEGTGRQGLPSALTAAATGGKTAGAPAYLSEIVVGDLGEWKLTLEQPAAPFQKALYASYLEKLTLLLVVLLASLGLAELLSRRMMLSLETLLQVTRALPARLASGATVQWPETSVSEGAYLMTNFREMADSLQDQFCRIQAAKEAAARQTELIKESEEKYRLLFDSANDAMFISEIDGRILQANPRAIERLGYSGEELAELSTCQIEGDGDLRQREERLAAIRRQTALTYETLHRPKEGTPVPVEVSARLIQWGDRPVILSICRDITERKQAYQARVIAMRDLISAIAHQWRQPLATLGMIVQRTHALGTRGELPPGHLDEFKANAMRQVRYMSDTIEEFRNFYRPDKERQEFSAVGCINEALQLLEAQLNHHAIAVQLEGGEAAGLRLQGGPSEFKQVILNLLANARDAILENREKNGMACEGRIVICLTAPQPGRLAIEVIDNGCGIGKEVEPRLFTPHFTTKSERGGTGIGLYLSRMIIEESMGGSLTLVPGGTGATFRIELPTGKES